MHGDHVLGLPGLLGSMNLFGRERSLYIAGPSTIQSYVRHALELTETYVRFPIEFIDCAHLDGDPVFEWGDNTIHGFAVNHRIERMDLRLHIDLVHKKIYKDSIAVHALRRSEIINLKAGADVTREDGSVLRVAELCAPLKQRLTIPIAGIPVQPNPSQKLHATPMYFIMRPRSSKN